LRLKTRTGVKNAWSLTSRSPIAVFINWRDLMVDSVGPVVSKIRLAQMINTILKST
jgi:hypothetical protein